MRYFSDALEDRRVSIGDSGINPYVNSYNTSSTELRKGLATGGKTLAPRTVSNITNTIPADSYVNQESSNAYQLSLSAKRGSNAAIISDWTNVGASSFDNTEASLPSSSDLSPEMRAHIEKFGETPTYVGKDGKVHVDREKLIQRVVDYHAGPEGGLKGFSVQGFMAAGHNERTSMLQDMRKQNDAAKAAKFEEDLRLAKERDAEKAAKNNPAASGNNGWGKAIATLGTLATAFIPKGSSS
jgi:hypothetical protein